MKKLAQALLVTVALLAGSSYLFAASSTVQSDFSATVTGVFQIAFYPRAGIDVSDPTIQFPNGQVTFPAITDLAVPMVYPTGRAERDGKSDVGILCLTNTGDPWNLKIHMVSTTIGHDNFIVYIPANAYFRNNDPATALGGVNFQEGWWKMWDVPTTVYAVYDHYSVNMPWGTLLTFNFAIVPSGKLSLKQPLDTCNGDPLSTGTHTATIYYTMTTFV